MSWCTILSPEARITWWNSITSIQVLKQTVVTQGILLMQSPAPLPRSNQLVFGFRWWQDRGQPRCLVGKSMAVHSVTRGTHREITNHIASPPATQFTKERATLHSYWGAPSAETILIKTALIRCSFQALLNAQLLSLGSKMAFHTGHKVPPPSSLHTRQLVLRSSQSPRSI